MFRAVIILGGKGGVIESVDWRDFTSGMAATVWLRGWLPDTSESSNWGWWDSNMVYRGWGAGFTWRELWVVDESGRTVPVFLG